MMKFSLVVESGLITPSGVSKRVDVGVSGVFTVVVSGQKRKFSGG